MQSDIISWSELLQTPQRRASGLILKIEIVLTYIIHFQKVVKFMAYKITDKCIACGACAANCPVSCISDKGSKYEIDPSMCISCGTCAQVCPVGAPEEE